MTDIETLAEQLEHHTRQAHESCPEVPEYAAILDVIAAWRAEKARADALDEAVTLALEDRDYFSDRLDEASAAHARDLNAGGADLYRRIQAAVARATQAEEVAESYRQAAEINRQAWAQAEQRAEAAEDECRMREPDVRRSEQMEERDLRSEVSRLTRELAEAKEKP